MEVFSGHGVRWTRGGGGGARGLGISLFAFGVAHWPPALAHATLRGSERVLIVSTEPPDDLSCLTTPGVGRPGDELLPVPLSRGRGGGGAMSRTGWGRQPGAH